MDNNMGNKEVKIVAPEGYEIDRKNSTLERIVFKNKGDKPRTWEEFCERGFTGEEAYLGVAGVTKSLRDKGDDRVTDAVGYVDNVKEAKAFVALMQLRQLRNAWVGNWEPDWKSSNTKCVIDFNYDEVRVSGYIHTNRALSFPTEEMAIEFVDCFKGLLEQAKILL